MAEREGFEPSMGVKAHTPLAGERLRPLGHLSEFLQYCVNLMMVLTTKFQRIIFPKISGR